MNGLREIRRGMWQRKANRRIAADKRAYLLNGRVPWSRGYQETKFDCIREVLVNEDMMTRFREETKLPVAFGYGLDERVVEYPWTLARLPEGEGRLLDAGSVFNFKEIVDQPVVADKEMTILTLKPEGDAFWERGISYQFADLRELLFRDNWFDTVVSLSTLGHVGMDCRIYTGKTSRSETIGLEAEKAVSELMRVLKPGGRLLVSVVYGKHQLIEWDGSPFAEQFDKLLLADLLKAFQPCASISTSFYQYTAEGWNVCSQEECGDVEYFNVHTAKGPDADLAAAARAVALIDVRK